jgi:outer membrane lipoprotein-sorting protein
MRRNNDNSWLDALLSQQVHHEPAKFDLRQWSQEHPDEARLLEHGFETPGRSRKTATYPIWRCIMKSRVTRYSAAAVVTLAAALVLLNPFGTSKQGVVLASVQEKVARVDTMILRGEKVFTCVADPNLVYRFDLVKYLSRQYGYVEEGRIHDALVYRIALNKPEQQCLVLLPLWKKCLRFPCTDEQIKIMEKLTPTGVVDVLLQTEYKRLGTATIDGVDAEGFELQDVKPVQKLLPKHLFDMQDGKATLWVGAKELLPVRMEGDFLIGKTFTTLFMDWRLHEVNTLDSYDVELDPKLFNTDMPEGYTELKFSDINPIKLTVPGLH